MEKSISFDRAAEFYDETRGHPAEVSGQIAASLTERLPAQARLLEVGVGTGRISRPLLGRSLRVTGMDLSRKMMDRLQGALPAGASRPDLVQADATEIPFAANVFDAVLTVHVLHLIAGWQSALAEIHRVLHPNGSLLVGYDWRPPDSQNNMIHQKLREIVLSYEKVGDQPGAQDLQEIVAALAKSGAVTDEWVAAQWETAQNNGLLIDKLGKRIWSFTWYVPDDILARSIDDLRHWAASEFGPLDRDYSVPRKFIWQRFRWAA